MSKLAKKFIEQAKAAMPDKILGYDVSFNHDGSRSRTTQDAIIVPFSLEINGLPPLFSDGTTGMGYITVSGRGVTVSWFNTARKNG